MAGLDPAIHVFSLAHAKSSRSSRAMTMERRLNPRGPGLFTGKPLDVDTGRRERRNVLGSMLMVMSPKLR